MDGSSLLPSQLKWNTSRLLQLPPELQSLITQGLPLSSHLIYRKQICSSLRNLFDGQLKTLRSYRFDLVEWRRAEQEVRDILARQESQSGSPLQEEDIDQMYLQVMPTKKSIWDTSPSSTPRPAPTKPAPHFSDEFLKQQQQQSQIVESEPSLLIYRTHPDVSLFVRSMQFLGLINNNVVDGWTDRRLWSGDITVLSLLSRSGFKVASLIQLLETQSCLYQVETVLMTSASFIDAVLWTVFTPPRAKERGSNLSSRRSTHFDMEFSQSTCIDTQAIVVPGPYSEKGQGLRSGFKCLCFSNFDVVKEEDHSSNNDQKSTPFHVIFHDWYNEEEAIGTQDMLENSDITCNTCKQKILF